MCQVMWCSFNWEAFAGLLGAAATLGAGGMAFLAARKIGTRQLLISERQNEILAGQLRLEELNFAESLFDRRYSVYTEIIGYLQRMAEFLGEVSTDQPNFKELLSHLDLAYFLFPPNCSAQIAAAVNAATRLESDQKRGDKGLDDLGLQYLFFIDELNKLKRVFAEVMSLHGEITPVRNSPQQS